MNTKETLQHFEELARKLDVKIRYERIGKESPHSAGGFCRIKDEYVVIIDSKATAREKIHILAKAIRHFDLGNMFVLPAVREHLDHME